MRYINTKYKEPVLKAIYVLLHFTKLRLFILHIGKKDKQPQAGRDIKYFYQNKSKMEL